MTMSAPTQPLSVTVSFVSLLCRDIVAQAEFYHRLLGFGYLTELESEHFRALQSDGPILGFSGPGAFDLLNIPHRDLGMTGTTFWTFGVKDEATVDAAVSTAESLGARVVKAPFRTYYGAWQAVLADPEENLFRFSCQ